MMKSFRPAATRFAAGNASAQKRRFRPILEELEPRMLLSGFQPTASEQLFLEDLNAARANPTAYGQSIGVDLSYIAPSAPLAFDTQLIQSARLHSQDMNDRGYFAHVTPEGITPNQRAAAAGYTGTFDAESIAAGYPDPASALAGLIIDQGVPDLGHRNMLLNVDPSIQSQNQVGVGIDLNGGGPYSDYYTIDSGTATDSRPFLTGVVFHDDNGNGKYDIGEGFADASVTVQGVGTTQTYNSGGYTIQLNPGTYTVTASGGGLAAPITQTVTVGNSNVELDFIGSAEGSWNTVAALPTARAGLAVVAGTDGRIYALGGTDASGQPSDALEAFTPGSNSWKTLANMPSPAFDLAATVGSDGRIYVFGGLYSSQTPLRTAEVYDPTTNTWSSLAAMPDARSQAAAVTAPDGRIYIIGGFGANGLTNVVDVYSPQTNKWSTAANLPTVRSGLAAVLGVDGRIYAIGGNNVHNQPLGTVEVYDPSANSWSSAADMPLPRANLAAVNGPDGRIYALGGFDEDGNPGGVVEVYSPVSGTWSTLADVPTARAGLGAAVGSDGRIYAVGGFHGTERNTVEALSVPMEMGFATPVFSAAPGATSITITVIRTGSLSGAVSVQFATSPGTAVPGVDYTPASGILSFAAGQSAQQFTVSLSTADGQGGVDKTIVLTLSNPSGGVALANPPTATIVMVESGSFLPPGGGGGGGGGGGQSGSLSQALSEGIQALELAFIAFGELPQILAGAGSLTQANQLFSAAYGLLNDEIALFVDVLYALEAPMLGFNSEQTIALADDIGRLVNDLQANAIYSQAANLA